MTTPGWDLVLSSGFLAVPRHCGVLAAVEERGLECRADQGPHGSSEPHGFLIGAFGAVFQLEPILNRDWRSQRLSQG